MIISGNIEIRLVSTIILIYNVLLIKYIRRSKVIIVLFLLVLVCPVLSHLFLLSCYW